MGWRADTIEMWDRGQHVDVKLRNFLPSGGALRAICDGRHYYRPEYAAGLRSVLERYNRHEGATPSPGCGCGYRVVRDLGSLAWYWGTQYRGRPGPRSVAFVRVAGWGRVVDRQPDVPVGAQMFVCDPPRCVRVSHMKLIGPVIVDPAAAEVASYLWKTHPQITTQMYTVPLLQLRGGAS